MSRTTNAVYNATPIFKDFLGEYCSFGGHMPLSDFGIAFGSYCIQKSRRPVSADILVILIERFVDDPLARLRGEVVIRLTCTFSCGIEAFEKKYRGMYDFY